MIIFASDFFIFLKIELSLKSPLIFSVAVIKVHNNKMSITRELHDFIAEKCHQSA